MSIDADLFEGAWSVEITPNHADTDLATSEVHFIYWADNYSYLAIVEDGAGTVEAVLATVGGNLNLPITYSRGDTLTLTVDFVAGELDVVGAPTGNKTAQGTISNWPVGTFFVGSDATQANYFDGLISEPKRVQTPLTILGSACTGWWNAQRRTDGTLPDVTTLINQADPGNGDVTQGTDTARPHLVGNLDGLAATQGVPNQYFVNSVSASPGLYSAGEHIAVWAVARLDTSTGTRALFEITNAPGGANGVTIQWNATLKAWQGRVRVAPADLDTAISAPYVDTSNLALLNVRTGVDEATLTTNGIETHAGDGGTMTNIGDEVAIHALVNGANPSANTISEVVLWRGSAPISDRLLREMDGYFRRKYRSLPPKPRVDPIVEAAGTSLTLWYNAESANWIQGSDPDVSDAFNLVPDSRGYADLDQVTVSARPHDVVALGGEGWEMTGTGGADDQYFQALGISPVFASTGDHLTAFVVAHVPTSDVTGLLNLTDSAGTNIHRMAVQSNEFRARSETTSGGTQTAAHAFTETTAKHVFQLTIDADSVTAGVDGNETDVSLTTGGIAADLERVFLTATGFSNTKTIFECVVLVNPTAGQITDTRKALGAKHGIGIA